MCVRMKTTKPASMLKWVISIFLLIHCHAVSVHTLYAYSTQEISFCHHSAKLKVNLKLFYSEEPLDGGLISSGMVLITTLQLIIKKRGFLTTKQTISTNIEKKNS